VINFSELIGVVGQLPFEIGNLTDLIILDISKSNLAVMSEGESEIPESIGLCTKLWKLDLKNCKLAGPFPTGIRTLKALGKTHQSLMI
jgi:hypothetical protein